MPTESSHTSSRSPSPAPQAARGRSLLARPLREMTQLVLRFPRLVLWLSLLLAIASIGLAVTKLGFHASRLALLNPDSAYNQRWLGYLDEFGREDDAVIVVEGPNRSAVVEAMDQLAKSLEASPKLCRAVLSHVDVSKIRGKGLHYFARDDLMAIQAALRQIAPALHGDWAHLEISTVLQQWNQQAAALSRMADRREAERQLEPLVQQVGLLLRGLADALGKSHVQPASSVSLVPLPESLSSNAVHLLAESDSRLIFDQGRLGVILVRLVGDQDEQFAHGTPVIAQLRSILSTVQGTHPDVKIGLTGLPVLENDEMRTSQNDMLIAGVVSLIGVACLFVAGFGGIRLPLMTVMALLIAMAWSFGFITLSVGHLNILSMSFGVILIGLGIDFGIHYVACFAQYRSSHLPYDEALVRTAASVGPGVLTGGLTTAVAFFSAALTDFTGVAELGLIAGGGILLCVIAALGVLPVLIQRWQRHETSWRAPRPLPFVALCAPALRAPSWMLNVSALVTLVLGVGIAWLTFDHNLLHLQADGLDSVRWENRLLETGDHSVWFAVSMSDTPEQLLRKKRQLEKLESVQRVEEIVSLLPSPDAIKSQMIGAIGAQLQGLPSQVPLLPVVPRAILIAELHRTRTLAGNLSHKAPGLLLPLSDIEQRLKTDNWPSCSARISRFQQQLAASTLGQLHQLRAIADPTPPKATDLPPAVLARFVGRHGRQLMRIYARGNIWHRQALAQFVHDLESVDPRVTGHPIQTYYASKQMQTSYIHAAVYSALAVAIILMLDFRSIRMVLLAMMPMACGMTQMLGLMGWLGIPLNPANMIVLPLILGIGIDDGVHMAHDYLRRGGTYRVGRSTAAAVVLTSATTMVGFGSMMLARHQGLRSLGQILTLGVFCCLATTLATLPAAFSVLARSQPALTRQKGPHRRVGHLLRPRRHVARSLATEVRDDCGEPSG